MEQTTKKLSDLTPNPQNPRTITDKKLGMLKKAMREFGSLDGIIYNQRTQRLCGGHQRRKGFGDSDVVITHKYAAITRTGTKAEGYVEIEGERFPYREVDWDEAKEKAANIAANKGAGAWDFPQLSEWMLDLDHLNFDLDLTMFDDEEREKVIVPIERVDPGCDEDHIPEVKEPTSKPGDLYQLGNHRLLCGDSTNIQHVELLLGGEKAELCFTSPPYSDQREYNGGKDLSTQHLATFIRSSAGLVGYFAINLGYSRKNMEVNPYWDDYIKEARACDLKLLSWNVWDRGAAFSIGQQTAMFPIENEWIFVFGRKVKELNETVPNKYFGEKTGKTNRQADGTLLRKKESIIREKREMGTVCRIGVDRDRSVDHPAKFPVELPCSYVDAMTCVGDTVYEPFCGSGSTLIACEKTDRVCFAMEIDPHYCDVIVARFEKFSGKKAVLVPPASEYLTNDATMMR